MSIKNKLIARGINNLFYFKNNIMPYVYKIEKDKILYKKTFVTDDWKLVDIDNSDFLEFEGQIEDLYSYPIFDDYKIQYWIPKKTFSFFKENMPYSVQKINNSFHINVNGNQICADNFLNEPTYWRPVYNYRSLWLDCLYDYQDDDGFRYIDAYESDSVGEEGQSVVKISSDLDIIYLNEFAKNDNLIQETILDAINQINYNNKDLLIENAIDKIFENDLPEINKLHKLLHSLEIDKLKTFLSKE
jgi:hypothetical protein